MFKYFIHQLNISIFIQFLLCFFQINCPKCAAKVGYFNWSGKLHSLLYCFVIEDINTSLTLTLFGHSISFTLCTSNFSGIMDKYAVCI